MLGERERLNEREERERERGEQGSLANWMDFGVYSPESVLNLRAVPQLGGSSSTIKKILSHLPSVFLYGKK